MVKRLVKNFLGLLAIFLFLALAFLPGLYAQDSMSEDELRQIFLAQVKARLGLKEETIKAEKFRVEPRLHDFQRGQSYLVDWVTEPRAGSNTMLLTYFSKTGEPKSLRLWGFVEVIAKVPVVVKPLPAGEILREEHVVFEKRELSRLPHDVIFDLRSALGKEIRVSLRPGMVLRSSFLQLPVLVKRNEEVEIFAQGKNFLVKAKGIALENGKLGEMIRVRNKESQRVIYAKVSGENRVEVSF